MFLSAFLQQCPWSAPCTPGQPGQEEHSQQHRMLCLYRPATPLPWWITTVGKPHQRGLLPLQYCSCDELTRPQSPGAFRAARPLLPNCLTSALRASRPARAQTSPQESLPCVGGAGLAPDPLPWVLGEVIVMRTVLTLHCHGHPPLLHPGYESGCRLHADSHLHFKGKDDCGQHYSMCIRSGPFACRELQRQV